LSHKAIDVGAAKHIGRYSDAIETAQGLRWLHTSGTPGVADDGTLPEGIEAEECAVDRVTPELLLESRLRSEKSADRELLGLGARLGRDQKHQCQSRTEDGLHCCFHGSSKVATATAVGAEDILRPGGPRPREDDRR